MDATCRERTSLPETRSEPKAANPHYINIKLQDFTNRVIVQKHLEWQPVLTKAKSRFNGNRKAEIYMNGVLLERWTELSTWELSLPKIAAICISIITVAVATGRLASSCEMSACQYREEIWRIQEQVEVVQNLKCGLQSQWLCMERCCHLMGHQEPLFAKEKRFYLVTWHVLRPSFTIPWRR